MNFIAEYSTAYNLLRQGSPDIESFNKLFPNGITFEVQECKEAIEAFQKRIGRFGRVRAAIYAFQMMHEMRRQKILINHLFNIKMESENRLAKADKRPITLFPITINRTVVKMIEKNKDD